MLAVPPELVEALEADRRVRLGVLFGSAAQGHSTSASDLDVGVLGLDLDALSALEVALSRAAGRTVDLIALDHAPPLLRFEIARDGRVLVERDAYLWPNFKARALVDWWDWAPTARRIHARAAARLRAQVASGSS